LNDCLFSFREKQTTEDKREKGMFKVPKIQEKTFDPLIYIQQNIF
jgi:hypothetical protein